MFAEKAIFIFIYLFNVNYYFVKFETFSFHFLLYFIIYLTTRVTHFAPDLFYFMFFFFYYLMKTYQIFFCFIFLFYYCLFKTIILYSIVYLKGAVALKVA